MYKLPSVNHKPYNYEKEIKKNIKVFYGFMKEIGYQPKEVKPLIDSILNLEHTEESIQSKIKYLMPGISFEKYQGNRIVGLLSVVNMDAKEFFKLNVDE